MPTAHRDVITPDSALLMILYKYLEPEWADRMVTSGSVRVGTLYDFRRQERLGAERGDPHEGKRSYLTDGKPGVYTADQLPPFVRSALKIPTGSGVKFQFDEGSILHVEQHAQDVYVFCTCSIFDETLMKRFGGACVEILDWELYFGAIREKLDGWTATGVRKVADFGLGPVEYEERKETWPNITPYDPIFRKAPIYAHQHEVRAVWYSPQRLLQPVNLEVLALRNSCRRIR